MELELQEVGSHPVWVLGIELKSSRRVNSPLLSYLSKPLKNYFSELYIQLYHMEGLEQSNRDEIARRPCVSRGSQEEWNR